MRKVGQKCVIFLATGCYAGYIPIAPGTFGTLVAIPLSYLLSRLGPFQCALFITVFSGVAIFISSEAEKVFNKKDTPLIVIDEIAGLLVTLFFIPWNAKTVITGFVIFRIMDITKPFPIRKVESKLKAGWGVVGDDLLAGIYANVVLRLIMQFF